MTVIGFDWDGTLVENWTATPLPGVREQLAALPPLTRTFIATNQAGPVFRTMLGDPKYPTAADVADRIIAGLAALDWRPDLLLIAAHPGREYADWQRAARARLLPLPAPCARAQLLPSRAAGPWHPGHSLGRQDRRDRWTDR